MKLSDIYGNNSIIEIDCNFARFDPILGDIAAVRLEIDQMNYPLSAINLDEFLTRSMAEDQLIGIGDDVFMLGMFIDESRSISSQRNAPFARFGNISRMPGDGVLIGETSIACTFGPKERFILDMHSRTGFSGSPVFVYRIGHSDLSIPASEQPFMPGNILYLLGMHRAQFVENWEARAKLGQQRGEASDPFGYIDSNRLMIAGLSGMTVAVPAWDIAALLRG